MKKTLAFMLTLIIVTLSLTGFAGYNIYTQGNTVTYELSEEFGDRNLLDGVSAEFSYSHNRRLKWNVQFTPLGETVNEHSFSKLVKSTATYFTRGLSNFWLDFSRLQSLSEELKNDVNQIKRYLVNNNDTQGFDFTLNEYFDYYPVIVDIYLGELSINVYQQAGLDDKISYDFNEISESRGYGFIDAMNEYFKIPVIENHTVHTTIRKNEERFSYSTYYENQFRIEFNNVITDDNLFFTINNKTTKQENGNVQYIDTSLIPGGYGIYAVPYTDNDIIYENLSTVYSIDSAKTVIFFASDTAKENLYLGINDDGRLIFKVIDIKTMTDVCELDLGELLSEDITAEIYDDFIILEDSSQKLFVLEKLSDGTYSNALSYSLEESNQMGWNHIPYSYSAVFDGERLVLMMMQEAFFDEPLYTCSPTFAVITDDGVGYYGTYICSLGDYSDINGGFISTDSYKIKINK